MSDLTETDALGNELGDIVATEAAWFVENVKHTHYQFQMVVDESTGTYLMDCSEFVSYVLQQTAPRHLAIIPRAFGAASRRDA
jgi:hypothetical protein